MALEYSKVNFAEGGVGVRLQFLAIANRVGRAEVSLEASHSPLRRVQQKQSLCWGVIRAIAGSMVMAVAPMPKATSQIPFLPQIQTPNNQSNDSDNRIVSGWIYLDGRQLFQIAATKTNFPERSQDIQQNLDQIIQNYLRSSAKEAKVETRKLNGLPVIYVNDQYLMTITSEDAQLRKEDPFISANQITDKLQDYLKQARQERQTQFLIDQGKIAAGYWASNDCHELGRIYLAAPFQK